MWFEGLVELYDKLVKCHNTWQAYTYQLLPSTWNWSLLRVFCRAITVFHSLTEPAHSWSVWCATAFKIKLCVMKMPMIFAKSCMHTFGVVIPLRRYPWAIILILNFHTTLIIFPISYVHTVYDWGSTNAFLKSFFLHFVSNNHILEKYLLTIVLIVNDTVLYNIHWTLIREYESNIEKDW